MTPSEYMILEFRWNHLNQGLIMTEDILNTSLMYYILPKYVSDEMSRQIQLIKYAYKDLKYNKPWWTHTFEFDMCRLHSVGPKIDEIIEECYEKFQINTDKYYKKYMSCAVNFKYTEESENIQRNCNSKNGNANKNQCKNPCKTKTSSVWKKLFNWKYINIRNLLK